MARKIINFENGRNIGKVKAIIARIYKVPKSFVSLDLWKTTWETSKVSFGYWIAKEGYEDPVAFQNDDMQLEVIMPDEYFARTFLKDIEEKKGEEKKMPMKK